MPHMVEDCPGGPRYSAAEWSPGRAAAEAKLVRG
jgi:hypothetical protein